MVDRVIWYLLLVGGSRYPLKISRGARKLARTSLLLKKRSSIEYLQFINLCADCVVIWLVSVKLTEVEQHVIVALYWGGEIIYDACTVQYSCDPRGVVKLSQSLSYAGRLLHNKIEPNIEGKLVVSGRFHM